MHALMKFHPGRVGVAAGALHELEQVEGFSHRDFIPLLAAHTMGEWGDVDKHDAKVNDEALKTGARILSAYTLHGVKLWVITDAAWDDDFKHRQTTTILRPEDY
jgi:hypothetical protein